MLKIIAEYQNSQNIQNIAGYKTVFIAKQPIIKLLLKIIDPAGLLSYIAQQMNIKIIGFITILVKNDRPGDDGTLRSVKLLVFLLGVIDIASATAYHDI